MLDTKVNVQLAIQPLHILFGSLEHVQTIEHHKLKEPCSDKVFLDILM